MVKPKKQKAADEKAQIDENTPVQKTEDVLFPIVEIGASAGGLEAIEHFLESKNACCQSFELA